MHHRLFPLTMLVSLFAVLTCPISYAQILQVQNGSFEESEELDDWHSDRAAHWIRWGHWINRETSWTPTRDGACMIGYHHWRIEAPDSSGIYQDVHTIPPEQTCRFSIDVFKDINANVECVELRIEPYGGGPTIGSEMFSMAELPADEWKTISVEGRDADNGLRFLVILHPKASGLRDGAIKFDRVTVQRAK